MRGPMIKRLLFAVFLAAVLCSGQDSISGETLTAKLDASITSAGILQATMTVAATGRRSLPTRQQAPGSFSQG
jgi:hypothetical protein